MTGLADAFSLGAGASKPEASNITADINAGGLESDTSSGGRIRITSSARRNRLIADLSETFDIRAGELEGVRNLVRPGFSEFRRQGLAQIENRRSSAVSNLRDNLARRRVSGSSFANDALARAEAQFAQEAASFSASSTLQELDVFTQLSNQIGDLRTQEVQTFINELNLQADIGLRLAGAATQALTAATVQQQKNAGAFVAENQRQVGQIAGAAAAGGFSCWVARAVYGPENPEWVMFRIRMYAGAPDWFFNFYMRHGQRVARFIERVPALKLILRPIMDRAWR